jgi:hypothetical protein
MQVVGLGLSADKSGAGGWHPGFRTGLLATRLRKLKTAISDFAQQIRLLSFGMIYN